MSLSHIGQDSKSKIFRQKYGEVMAKIGKNLKFKPQSYFEMSHGK
jgi:hypothetical protein